MNKLLLQIKLLVCCLTLGVNLNAQGTWMATGTEAAYPVTTEMGFGIANLLVMHTDPSGSVIGKPDVTAPTDGFCTNTAIIQGATNGMYYAFKPSVDGALSIATKMGVVKPFYLYESTSIDLATVAASGSIIDASFDGTTVPATLTDGSTIINGSTFSATTYTTVNFNVKANKIYVIGCTGTKIQIRGVKFALGSVVVPSTYNVTFNTTPSYTNITFNGKIQMTYNGTTTFTNVLAGTYNYTVGVTGYTTESGSLVVSSNIMQGVNLVALPTYTVTFNTSPTNASVTFNGTTQTAVNGVTSFTNISAGSFGYTVSKSGYTSASGTLTVSSNAVQDISLTQLPTYSVTFNTSPADASVTINGTTQTAVNGVTTFSNVLAGSQSFTVSKSGYTTASGSINVTSNTSQTVNLAIAPTYTVTFNVNPTDATIIFNGSTKTAVAGVATFTNVVASTLPYSVSRSGYETDNGTITVSSNTSKSIYLLQPTVSTWMAIGTETMFAPGTDMNLGITNLTVMHSDGNSTYTGVIGKTDVTAIADGIFNNLAIIQGETNGMFYSFKATVNGKLYIGTKMGSSKPLYVTQTTGDQATITTPYNTSGAITTVVGNPVQVFDNYTNSTNIWQGAPLQLTGASVYCTLSFDVTAGNIYTVGVFGSKLMIRGISFVSGTTTDIESTSSIDDNTQVDEIMLYGIDGRLIDQKNKISVNEVVSSLPQGIYIMKTTLNRAVNTKRVFVK